MIKRIIVVLIATIPLYAQWWNTAGRTSVFAGGLALSSWSNDIEISDTALAAGVSGVTAILPYWNASMYQDGNIRSVKMWIKTNGGAAWRLKCYSTDWAGNYTFVSQSATFTPVGTGQVTTSVNLATCPVTSVLSLFVPHGSALFAKTTAIVSTPWESGDVTTFVAGGTLASSAINLIVNGDPPFLLVAGDSISEGVPAYHNPFDSFLAGYNVQSQIVYQAQQLINPLMLYQSYGVGSQTCDYVDSIMISTINPVVGPAFYLHCGINDISAGITWTTGGATGLGIQGALNSIKSKLPAKTHLFLDEILPYSGGSGPTIVAMNANYAAWAAANGATMVLTHDIMGCPAGSNTMCPAYGGPLHPNVTGYGVMGGVLAPTLQSWFAHNLFPLPNTGLIWK